MSQQPFYNVQALPSPPPTKQCSTITHVAPNSVAAVQGVVVGDWLVSVNLNPPRRQAEAELLEQLAVYSIYKRASGELLTLEAHHVPIGIDFEHSVDDICEMAEKNRLDTDDLADFAVAADHEDIMRVLNSLLNPRLGSKLVRWLSSNPLNKDLKPLYQGMVAFYKGNAEQANEALQIWEDEHAGYYTTKIRALGHYYLALTLQKLGYDTNASLHFANAFHFHPNPRYEAQVENPVDVEESQPEQFVGEAFFDDYRFEALWCRYDEPRTLHDSLERLQPGQVHTVVLLGSYRANGYYHDCLINYAMYRKLRPDIFCSLDVITSNNSDEMAAWLGLERWLQNAGQMEQVLHDTESPSLAQQAELRLSPTVLVLDNTNTIVYEGPMIKAGPVFALIAQMDEQKNQAQ